MGALTHPKSLQETEERKDFRGLLAGWQKEAPPASIIMAQGLRPQVEFLFQLPSCCWKRMEAC